MYLDLHGLIFETSICYWQDQPGSRSHDRDDPDDRLRGSAGVRAGGPGRAGLGMADETDGRTDGRTERRRRRAGGRPVEVDLPSLSLARTHTGSLGPARPPA